MLGILDLRHNYSILLYEKKHESKILVLLSRQYLVDKVPEMPNKRKELPTKMKGKHEESYANNLENMFEYVERHGIYPQSAYSVAELGIAIRGGESQIGRASCRERV